MQDIDAEDIKRAQKWQSGDSAGAGQRVKNPYYTTWSDQHMMVVIGYDEAKNNLL